MSLLGYTKSEASKCQILAMLLLGRELVFGFIKHMHFQSYITFKIIIK